MTFCSKRYKFATVLVLGILVSSGCSVLPNPSTKELPTEVTANANGTAPAPPAKFYVEAHSAFGQPKLYTGTITQPTTVQAALEMSGLLRSVRSPEVDLYRRIPGAPPLKLPIEFKGDRVKYEQDYALHPNDRVVVRNKSNSPIDKIVDTLTFGQ